MNHKPKATHYLVSKEGLEILREVFNDQGKVVIEEWMHKFTRCVCMPYMRVIQGGKK